MPDGRWALAAGAATWLGALAGIGFGLTGFVLLAGVVGASSLAFTGRVRAGLLAMLVIGGAISGAAAQGRIEATLSAPLPSGPIAVSGEVVADPVPARRGWSMLIRSPVSLAVSRPVVRVDSADRADAVVGDTVAVEGELRARPGRLRGDPYAGVVAGSEVTLVAEAPGIVLGIA